jgi:hypothetical protein
MIILKLKKIFHNIFSISEELQKLRRSLRDNLRRVLLDGIYICAARFHMASNIQKEAGSSTACAQRQMEAYKLIEH